MSSKANTVPGPWAKRTGPYDRHGRCEYFVYWVADYHPGHPEGEHRIAIRGQVYFADPKEHGHDKYADWPGIDRANMIVEEYKSTTQ